VTIPADTSHRQLSAEALKERGISDTLIRMSVGIEDEEDIIEDVGQALEP
jgi:O-acetylhomoserine/O-acetylserine sulfhydrylase-like pyridoxal-dependent enzyme